MKTSEEAMLAEHILNKAAPQNFDMAFDIASIFGEVRKQIIRDGTQALKGRLEEAYADLDFEVKNSFFSNPLQAYVGLSLRKKSWQGDLWIILQADRGDASEVFLGVYGPNPAAVPEGLVARLNETVKPGKASKEYPWYYMLGEPYRSWSNKQVLVELWTGVAAERLFEQMDEVVRAVDAAHSASSA